MGRQGATAGAESHLVTGGAGFIGSHLTEALLARGHRVTVLDDLSTGSLANLAAVADHPDLEVVKGSVTDADLVGRLVAAVDGVFHLASAVGVELVLEDTLDAFTSTVRGAEVVLGAAARHGRRVVLTSSSEVYGKSAVVPLEEDGDRLLGDPSVARWSYATAKATAEVIAFARHRADGLPVVVARLFNTVGPRQSPAHGMVVPRMVGQAVAGRPLTVYGSGTQTRCFGHVEDVVRGLLALAGEPRAVGLAVNLGSTEEVTIGELARRIAAAAGTGAPVELVPYADAYGPGFEDMERRVPSVARARRLVGWSARRDLDSIVAELVGLARGGTA